MSQGLETVVARMAHPERHSARRVAIAVISFLTLVDLFAAQAVLPTLAAAYGVGPAAMGFAVNASTIGMAAAGIAIALFGNRINRRKGIVISLALLSIPTALLATHPPLEAFTVLRILQGIFMASAFTLTMAYLAEQSSADDIAGALAAYVTGNVASNLIGRLLSAAVADQFGLPANFLVLAGFNIAGAILVHRAFDTAPGMPDPASREDADMVMRAGMGKPSAWLSHLANPALAAIFAIGFLILLAFIGTFTYVNFVLVRTPLSLKPMSLGFVYLVFLPALL